MKFKALKLNKQLKKIKHCNRKEIDKSLKLKCHKNITTKTKANFCFIFELKFLFNLVIIVL